MLTASQLTALEKAKSEKEAHGEFDSECLGYYGVQDTFSVGNMKTWRKTRKMSFVAASSLGKWPLARTGRRSLAFKASIAFVV